jgi:uncharacterized RDD family membrane protein YckC
MSQATIDSPARGRPRARLRYASFESRIAAGALDLLVVLIIAALFIIAGALIVLLSSDFERVDPSPTAINIFWGSAGCIPVAILLYAFIGFAWKGQTVGHSVMQTMVIRSDGHRLGVLGSAARVIALLVYPVFVGAGAVTAYSTRSSPPVAGASVTVAFLLMAAGMLIAVFDGHRRMLHDRIAGTIVVRLE